MLHKYVYGIFSNLFILLPSTIYTPSTLQEVAQADVAFVAAVTGISSSGSILTTRE